jgi:4-hydroxy-3-methylbut-2-enyl diphosphate reductase
VNAAVAKAFSLKNVYCLHELVHNEIIVGELKELGFRFVDSVEQVPEGECVVFSAHGVSPAVREQAEKRRLKVVDTTCPFVAKVHEEAKAFVQSESLVLDDYYSSYLLSVYGVPGRCS